MGRIKQTYGPFKHLGLAHWWITDFSYKYAYSIFRCICTQQNFLHMNRDTILLLFFWFRDNLGSNLRLEKLDTRLGESVQRIINCNCHSYDAVHDWTLVFCFTISSSFTNFPLHLQESLSLTVQEESRAGGSC